MHFCADCGQVLDVLSGRVDPCSSCGSTNVSVIAPAETATATVAVAPPGIQSLMNWSLVWLRVARERVAAAHAARKLFRSNPSGALSAEFHAGLIAIAAAAFAVEAEQLRVLGSKPKPVSPPPTRPWIGNAGDWLGQVLIEKGSIDVATAEGLGRLFDLRNSSVHPVATNELLVPHPVGTKTSPELVTYNADVAQELVNVADAVVAAISA